MLAVAIRPIPPERRPLRFAALAAGLTMFGISDGLILVPALGADPWDVLHQGLARSVGGAVGTWSVIVGSLVLLGWIPLRQRPGIGTLCNVATVGTVLNLTLAICPTVHGIAARMGLLLAGVLLNACATGAYIGAGLGPGPRDGIMTGIAARGYPIRVVRTGIELTALGTGWLLGGTVGIGTVIYALAIGPLVHWTIPALRLR